MPYILMEHYKRKDKKSIIYLVTDSIKEAEILTKIFRSNKSWRNYIHTDELKNIKN